MLLNLSDGFPIRPVWFTSDVVAEFPHTGAAPLSLVLREDDITAQRCQDRLHRHEDFYALYVVRQGRGIHVIDGTPYGVARGDVYLMTQGVTHLYTDCDDLILDALYFSREAFDPPMRDAILETGGFLSLLCQDQLPCAEYVGMGARRLHLSPNGYASLTEMMTELREEWARGTHTSFVLARGLFLRLLIFLARRDAMADSAQDLPGTVQQSEIAAAAVRLMDAHFAEPLRIDEIAASLFLSADRFTVVFTSVMGRTPRDYLRYLRLEHAKVLLKTTEDPVGEIGLKAGFSEAAYFSRVFREATGMTPREYRQR